MDDAIELAGAIGQLRRELSRAMWAERSRDLNVKVEFWFVER